MTAWQPGMFVMHGMVYEHDGKHYRARYGHTALPEFPPDKTPDLFDPISEKPMGSSHTQGDANGLEERRAGRVPAHQ